MFFEPSTRTFHSFEIAMKLLGGQVSVFQNEYSSEKKGETLEGNYFFIFCLTKLFLDTITMMAQYTNLIVLRHSDVSACERAQRAISTIACSTPIINAGDGTGLF